MWTVDANTGDLDKDFLPGLASILFQHYHQTLKEYISLNIPFLERDNTDITKSQHEPTEPYERSITSRLRYDETTDDSEEG